MTEIVNSEHANFLNFIGWPGGQAMTVSLLNFIGWPGGQAMTVSLLNFIGWPGGQAMTVRLLNLPIINLMNYTIQLNHFK
jgi:hypothetical protein